VVLQLPSPHRRGAGGEVPEDVTLDAQRRVVRDRGPGAETERGDQHNTLHGSVICFLALALAGCRGAVHKQGARAAKSAQMHVTAGPARAQECESKGMELYSWKPVGGEWHFSLLEGTNRLKAMAEVKDLSAWRPGIPSLKAKLSKTRRGEQVLWSNEMRGMGGKRLAWPDDSGERVPQEIVLDLVQYCSTLKIQLNAPGSAN